MRATRFFQFRCFPAHGRGEQGSALVEFVLSATILLTIVFGIFDTTLALYSNLFVSEAARSATRYAIVRGANAGTSDCSSNSWASCAATSTDISNYVKNLGFPLVDSSRIAVSTQWLTSAGGTCTGSCNSPGNQVQVSVSYPYAITVPFVSLGTLNLTGNSQMVIQQ